MNKYLKASILRTHEALNALDESLVALQAETEKHRKLLFEDAVAKRFEVAFEAIWKLFKLMAEEQGSEAPGPKPAIAVAFRYRWIEKNPELWQAFLEARNSGVHEYFSLPKREYLSLVKKFGNAAKVVVQNIQTYERSLSG